ncbi:LysR substrate-binding domain-containing protein [Sphingomonas sp.]|uniref:LysR substrate-binding domain-containing protein n=1 Tax=Sphingomonas sp. TaxID=28214 RepID=UPI0038A2A40F
MRRLPPVGSIQAFVAVARLGSLKAAAETLALSSPALTRRIQSLEQFVGAPLFDRQHNSVEVNTRGAAFLTEIEPHVDALALAVERVSTPPNSMRLRIAVPSLFASQRLMPALPLLRARHPNLTIDVETAPNRISLLSEGADAAIAISERIDDRLYARRLERGRVVAIGSRRLSDVREPADLQRVPILLHRDMPDLFNTWRKAIGMPGLEPADTSYFDAGQLILDAAAGGLGVAFMLESHLSRSVDDRLVQLFGHAAESPYTYWFACVPAALERRPVRLFHDWLFEHFGSAEEAPRRAAAG